NVYDNDVVRGSGADGIIVHRNSTGVIVENNHISNSGKHGVYAQGDHLIIRGNVVFDNVVDGIKMGSHETQLFDATQPYHSKNNIIENNIYFNNSTEGIYLQTPYENVSILNNQSFGNGDNGIKTAYISSERFYADGLKIDGNQTQNIAVSSFLNVSVINNN